MNFSATFIISRLRVTENYGKIPINKVNFLLLLVVKRDKNEKNSLSHHSVQLIVFSLLPSSYFPATSVYIQLHCFEDISFYFSFLISLWIKAKIDNLYIELNKMEWKPRSKVHHERHVEANLFLSLIGLKKAVIVPSGHHDVFLTLGWQHEGAIMTLL